MPELKNARILMTGSRSFTDAKTASDSLQAGINLLSAAPLTTTLVHGAARGADLLLANEAIKLKVSTEAHPAQWNLHTDKCPAWDRANSSCKIAGFRRNTEMIQSGADLCLAFPSHGYLLAPGQDRANSSRGTWACATEARDTGIPTLVVWGDKLFPFGENAQELMQLEAAKKGLKLGSAGELKLIDAWLPF